jgi:hypothetical protein
MMSRDTQDYSPQNLAAAAKQILAYFGNHLVSLGGSYVEIDAAGRDVGEEKFFAYSGFVMSVRGVWCLVTAGHCIENLEQPLRAKRILLTSCVLADYFGSAPRVAEPMPFDYEGAHALAIHDSAAGLDFALVPLRDFYRMSLEANGIRAISEENWVAQDPAACDFFALLGLPECLVPDPRGLVPHGDRVAGVVNPTLVWVHPVTLPPEDIPTATFPWFIGRVGSAAELSSIVGMSGGPIFGFKKGMDGLLRYWIVAVQSWWRPATRITFGCPVRTFAALVEKELQRHADAVTGAEGC